MRHGPHFQIERRQDLCQILAHLLTAANTLILHLPPLYIVILIPSPQSRCHPLSSQTGLLWDAFQLLSTETKGAIRPTDGGRQSEQPRANIPWWILSKLSPQVAFSFSARARLRPVYASGEPGLTPGAERGDNRDTVVFIKPVWMIQQACGRATAFGASRLCCARFERGSRRLEPNIYLFRKGRNCCHRQARQHVLFLRDSKTLLKNTPPPPSSSSHQLANVVDRRRGSAPRARARALDAAWPIFGDSPSTRLGTRSTARPLLLTWQRGENNETGINPVEKRPFPVGQLPRAEPLCLPGSDRFYF